MFLGATVRNEQLVLSNAFFFTIKSYKRLHKVVYKFDAIPIKIPPKIFFAETEKPIFTFI